MHKLFVVVLLACLTGCGSLSAGTGSAQMTSSAESKWVEEEEAMQIMVRSEDGAVIYALDHTQAARALYAQLPLTVTVEDFSTNEKVFYPPQKLDTQDTPLADGGQGTLAYYAPWGDVVMFYDHFSPNDSLYALGKAVSGQETIENLSGMITITAYEEGLHE